MKCKTPVPMTGKSRGHPAFTLVELLVVITIIGILIALLLPALAAARAMAEQTVCLSNQRQCSLGFIEYAQEYHNTIVTYRSWGGHEDFWPTWMCYGYSITPGATADPQGGTIYISPAVASCPTNPAPMTQTQFLYDGYAACFADYYTASNPNLTFMQDVALTPMLQPPYAWSANVFVQVEYLNRLTRPDSTILLSDSTTQSYPWGPWKPGEQIACFSPDTTQYDPYSGGIFTPHGNSVAGELANCVFYDGHAESLSPGKLYQTVDKVTQFFNFASNPTQIINGVPIQ